MRVAVAMDSFKGSLSSTEAGNAVADGIRRVDADAQIDVRPLADGGEGTVDALIYGMNGQKQQIQVTGPLGENVLCEYGIVQSSKTAVIEIAGAAGITLVPETRRNPLFTTTYGVGEVIKDALEKGCRRFIIGLGGSATNDGGAGMLQALGYGLLNREGMPISRGAQGLSELVQITDSGVVPELRQSKFLIACDVKNPLCGKEGCSAVYGPQKGADTGMIAEMDRWLADYAVLAERVSDRARSEYPGAGAAGGLGFTFLTFMDANLESGIAIVLEETGFEAYAARADIIVTGEGRLDGQTAMGKAPVGVAKMAKRYKKPVIAFAGSIAKGAGRCNENGIDAFFSILRSAVSLKEAMNPELTRQNLADTAEQVFRLWQARMPFEA